MCVYVCVYTYVFMDIYMCVYIYGYGYIHVCVHTHIHTCIHTYILETHECEELLFMASHYHNISYSIYTRHSKLCFLLLLIIQNDMIVASLI